MWKREVPQAVEGLQEDEESEEVDNLQELLQCWSELWILQMEGKHPLRLFYLWIFFMNFAEQQ